MNIDPIVFAGLMDIDDVVCMVWGIKKHDLQLKTRKREIVEARFVTMWYRLITGRHTLEYIGKNYAGLNHCTVLHGKKRVNEWIKTDKVFRGMVVKVLKQMMILEPECVEIILKENRLLFTMIPRFIYIDERGEMVGV